MESRILNDENGKQETQEKITNVVIRKSSTDGKYLCPVCTNYASYTQGSLLVHINGRHRKERPDEIFNIVFINEECNEKEDECDDPGRSSEQISTIIVTLDKNGTYVCPLCFFSSKNKSQFSMHYLATHKESPGEKIEFSFPEKGYFCDRCKYTYRSQEQYDLHVSNCDHHRCKKCRNLFDTKAALKKHQCSPKLRYKCQMCQKKFKLKCNLNRHVAAHEKKNEMLYEIETYIQIED